MEKGTKQPKNKATRQMVNEKPKNTGLQVIKPGDEPQAIEAEFKQMDEPKKMGLNLAETLKIVEELHLKKRHRDRLELSIDELEEFEIKRQNEDLDEKSYYQGCVIKVTDDNRKEWSTKNPSVIAEVVAFLKSKFLEKLSEIESQIILPA